LLSIKDNLSINSKLFSTLLKDLRTFAEIILCRKEARKYNRLSIPETNILKGQFSLRILRSLRGKIIDHRNNTISDCQLRIYWEFVYVDFDIFDYLHNCSFQIIGYIYIYIYVYNPFVRNIFL